MKGYIQDSTRLQPDQPLMGLRISLVPKREAETSSLDDATQLKDLLDLVKDQRATLTIIAQNQAGRTLTLEIDPIQTTSTLV